MGSVTEILWRSAQSVWVWGTVGVALWISAWMYYLRGHIRTHWLETQPHRWGVDMQARKVTAGKKPIV
jgi:hypothetical protein